MDGVDLSGDAIAATGFANLLTDRTLTPVDLWTVCALLLLFSCIVSTLAHLLPVTLGVPVALALVVAFAGAVIYAFAVWAMLPPVATPALVQASAALLLGLFGQHRLERQRGKHLSATIK